MLAKPFEPRYLSSWEYIIYQPKINGERCLATVWVDDNDKYHCKLVTSQDNEIPYLDEIKFELCNILEHINSLFFIPIQSLTFDGELYVHGLSKQKLRGIVSRRVSKHPDDKIIQYYIFDLKDEVAEQYDRMEALSYIFKYIDSILHDHIVQVPTKRASTDIIDLIHIHMEEFVSQGYEGIILRKPNALYQDKRTKDLLKLKPRFKEEYEIIDAFEAIDIYGQDKDTLGGFNLVTLKGNHFKCGAGCLTHSERDSIWEEYKQSQVSVRKYKAIVAYQELTDRGVPHQPILKELKR